MKKLIEFLVCCFFRTAFWFRYRIHYKGLENLNASTLNKPGGVLFLPNHPTVFVDSTAILIGLWPKFTLRPLIVEYMYYLPVINFAMRKLNALAVPDFDKSSNSLKKKKIEKIIQSVIEGLHHKDNFLLFPSGRTKSTAYEAIDGASAAHRIVQDAKDANIVLVRVKGLWGSSFSRAMTGKAAPFFPTLMKGIKAVFKNFLFFTPRREIIIEFVPAPADFPYNATRIEFNKYLEQWYNKPDGLRPQTAPLPGDSLIQIPYTIWSNEVPKLWQPKVPDPKDSLPTNVPKEVQQKVLAELATLLNKDPSAITPSMNLSSDLGMDSLDISELISFLQTEFEVDEVRAPDLGTVGQVMQIAAKIVVIEDKGEEILADTAKWTAPREHKRIQLAEGETIPEVFLNRCAMLGSTCATADAISGILSYSQLKMRALLLADHIRKFPGEYVGILLPASTGATLLIFACQLAGKIPLMVNWTIGPRHLKAVAELTNVEVVLTSWSFIERLHNVDLEGIEDKLVMLEDERPKFTIGMKLKALLQSKLPTSTLLKMLPGGKLTPDSTAVLLFTSGTESLPKGVPLTHKNVLTNQRAVTDRFDFYTDDVLLAILPPFHSFGFTVSSFLGLLAGLRIAYSPDPTDGKRLAQAFAHWKATIVCGAPTFIRAMLQAATPDQLKTMRYCVTGAEKMPPDIEKAMAKLGKSEGLIEGYGVTECSPIISSTLPRQPRVGIGKPFPGIEVKIIDLATDAPVPSGTQGMIITSGPNVFNGYLNPGLASPFLNMEGKRWYITGDLGYLDPEGNIILTGRLKRFVKVGGEMLSLASLEEALNKAVHLEAHHTNDVDVPALAITAKEIAGERPQIALFSTTQITVDKANKILKEAGFSNLVKISAVKILPELPLMGTGKINYRKLEEL